MDCCGKLPIPQSEPGCTFLSSFEGVGGRQFTANYPQILGKTLLFAAPLGFLQAQLMAHFVADSCPTTTSDSNVSFDSVMTYVVAAVYQTQLLHPR